MIPPPRCREREDEMTVLNSNLCVVFCGGKLVKDCLAEKDAAIQRLDKDYGEAINLNIDANMSLIKANKTIQKLEAGSAVMRQALEDARNNIGVPQPGYPAPFAHAYDLITKALAALDSLGKEKP